MARGAKDAAAGIELVLRCLGGASDEVEGGGGKEEDAAATEEEGGPVGGGSEAKEGDEASAEAKE